MTEKTTEVVVSEAGNGQQTEKKSRRKPAARKAATTKKKAAKKEDAVEPVIEVKETKTKPRAGSFSEEGSETWIDDDQGEATEKADEGSGSGHNGGHGGGDHSGDGDGYGDGRGPHPKEQKKKTVNISAIKARVVCLNKDRGEYSVTFVPSISAVDGVVELYMSAETQNYKAPITKVIGIGQTGLEIAGNKICNVSFEEKKPVRLRVTIDYHDYCSMEVKAYGNKE